VYKKECEAGIKQLEKISSNANEFYGSAIKLIAELSSKYGM
jgi:hypothetical protein